MLRPLRNQWDMHFAPGGAEALAELAQDDFQVIVTDMRMPGIDGAELLTRVAKLYPDMVRIVLSGQSEHEKIFRAIGPAHQFLSKPCDPDVLVETIRRACSLQKELGDDSLTKLTSRITSLPSLPSVYRQLHCELESDDASLDRIGEVIGGDLAMTAKVLQLVNSSFFGLPQHVACPKHAVSLLGLNVIRSLALTAGVFSQYDEPGIDGYSLEQSISHSLAVAIDARTIASGETSDHHIIDDAFLAGMLHDIGKLVLAVNLTDRFGEAIELARRERSPLFAAEREVFGTTHAEVGAHLLGLWGLPHPIVTAVAFHHQPIRAGDTDFAPLSAVHVANIGQHGRAGDDQAAPTCDREYLESIGASARLGLWTGSVARESAI